MFSLSSSLRYYLYAAPTDMRKSFDALCLLVEMGMQRNPLSGEVFIFINRPRNRMKLLKWEYGGFVLYYKRLEKGNFELPDRLVNSSSVLINWAQLVMMVEGISIKGIRTRKRYTDTEQVCEKFCNNGVRHNSVKTALHSQTCQD